MILGLGVCYERSYWVGWGGNTYAYVGGNPVGRIDPLGLFSACLKNVYKRVGACRAIADKANWLCTLVCVPIRNDEIR